MRISLVAVILECRLDISPGGRAQVIDAIGENHGVLKGIHSTWMKIGEWHIVRTGIKGGRRCRTLRITKVPCPVAGRSLWHAINQEQTKESVSLAEGHIYPKQKTTSTKEKMKLTTSVCPTISNEDNTPIGPGLEQLFLQEHLGDVVPRSLVNKVAHSFLAAETFTPSWNWKRPDAFNHNIRRLVTPFPCSKNRWILRRVHLGIDGPSDTIVWHCESRPLLFG